MNWWKSFTSKVSIARQLSLRDWLLMAEAWWVLTGFHLALRWVSLERLERTFRLSGSRAGSTGRLPLARQLQRLVTLASRLHFLPVACLARACTLHWMLGRGGVPSRLCIGVDKSSQGFYAHAWVNVEGEAVGEPGDISTLFKVLNSLEPEKP